MENSLASSLPTFSGLDSENITFFISQIEEVAALENWSLEKKAVILKLNCKGKALEVISSAPSGSKGISFDKLKKLLISKFAKRETFEQISQNFSNLVQKPGQSVKELAEEITILANKFTKINQDSPDLEMLREKMKFTKLIEALRGDIKIEVQKFGPSNFQAAVRRAIKVETALDNQAVSLNNLKANDNIDIQVVLENQFECNKKILELTNKIDSLTKNVKGSTTTNEVSCKQNEQTVKCHICGKRHLTTECWYFPKEGYTNSNFSRAKTFSRGNRFSRGGNHPYRRGSNFNARRNLNK